MIVIVVLPAMVIKRVEVVEMIGDVSMLGFVSDRGESERVDDVRLTADDEESNLKVTDESVKILGFES